MKFSMAIGAGHSRPEQAARPALPDIMNFMRSPPALGACGLQRSRTSPSSANPDF